MSYLQPIPLRVEGEADSSCQWVRANRNIKTFMPLGNLESSVNCMSSDCGRKQDDPEEGDHAEKSHS